MIINKSTISLKDFPMWYWCGRSGTLKWHSSSHILWQVIAMFVTKIEALNSCDHNMSLLYEGVIFRLGKFKFAYHIQVHNTFNIHQLLAIFTDIWSWVGWWPRPTEHVNQLNMFAGTYPQHSGYLNVTIQLRAAQGHDWLMVRVTGAHLN